MKKLILLFLFIPIVSFGQDTIPATKILTQKKVSMKFNHQALLVNDLNLSGDFYRDVLGLEEIEVGAGQNPPKRWFKNNQGIEMHLISSEEKLSILPKGIHMAFTVKNFDEFINHLKNKNINAKYLNSKTVKMLAGGNSNKLKNILKKMSEDLEIIKNNEIGNFKTLILKNTSKLSQFFI